MSVYQAARIRWARSRARSRAAKANGRTGGRGATRTAVGAVLLLVVVAVLAGAFLSGAQAHRDSGPPPGASGSPAIVPDPARARADSGDVYRRGCSSGYNDAEVHPCVFDHSTSADAPLVVAAGDSKTAQWVPALQALAEQEGWRLVTMTKSSCPFSDLRRRWKGQEYTGCVTWNREAEKQVLAMSPDLLVTTYLDYYPTMRNGKVLEGEANRTEMVRGLSARLTRMKEAGIPVVSLAETPRMKTDAAACVLEHFADPGACAWPRTDVLTTPSVVGEAARSSGTGFLDLTDRFCPARTCPAVTGNILMYRDTNHLTATWARAMAPAVRQGLTQILEPALRRRLLGG